MVEYGTFAKFYSPQEAKELLQLLEEENIPYQIIEERNQLDNVMIGDAMDPMFAVSIPVDQFSKVHELTGKTFTYIVKNEADLAEKLESYDHEEPERLALPWIVLGYLLSFFMIAGLLAGIAITQSTKRLPDGSKMKIYDSWSIRHGRIMIVIGIVTTIWGLVASTKDMYKP
ncbi:MAG: hypothetical protein J7497_09160 [Chitinophagaceae bacterium]|nr:hypothetical protein [Chitinophagaceae bacterium]